MVSIIIDAKKTLANLIIVLLTLKSLIIFFRVNINIQLVTIIALDVAIAIPITPKNFDKVTLKIIFITTPIIPFIVVSFVFPIEKRVEFNISLSAVKKIPIAYPINAILVKLTASIPKAPLIYTILIISSFNTKAPTVIGIKKIALYVIVLSIYSIKPLLSPEFLLLAISGYVTVIIEEVIIVFISTINFCA
ncbi:hypothetical protein D3C76_1296230 [compost metagenome]